ncbi:MAG: ABC transporter ATP-binding protein [Acidobacteriota bacterium]
MTPETLLQVKDLEVTFALRSGKFQAVKGVSFDVAKGERLGLVGESGAGKSITGFSIINLISQPGYISGGQVLFEGRDLSKLSPEEMRSIRGDRVAMIFQDPMMTLNPVLTIGQQMIETVRAHRDVSEDEARAIAMDKLAKVHISSPERRLKQYPHEFSGGMRQRIVIAISLLSDPALIIADEPSTALDVTIQAEIMELLLELCESERMGLILISHDLGVVSQVTQRMAIMYAGSIVEVGPTAEIITNPSHPYTQGLLAALPGLQKRRGRLNQIPGVMPGLTSIPPGCAFHPRCQNAMPVCSEKIPALCDHGAVRVACHAMK